MSESNETAPFKVGTVIAAMICAAPLYWRQIPNMSTVLYPLLLLGIGWGAGWLVSKYLNPPINADKPFAQTFLFLAACLGLGFFVVWASALVLEVAGNIWRGNIRDSNLLFGLMSLVAGLWSAYAMRLIDSSREMPSTLLAVGGAVAILLIMYSGVIYQLPDFDLLEHLDSSFIRTEYVVYGLFEVAYWRLLLPIAFAAALLFRLIFDRA